MDTGKEVSIQCRLTNRTKLSLRANKKRTPESDATPQTTRKRRRFAPEGNYSLGAGDWRDRDDLAKLDGGSWMLRTAADVLSIDQEEVNRVLKAAE